MKVPLGKSLSLVFLSLAATALGQPSCQVKNQSLNERLSVASGIATGFEPGKVYVTLTNGTRKYTTVAEKDGHWALSFPFLEQKSEILCWQEGNCLNAKNILEKN